MALFLSILGIYKQDAGEIWFKDKKLIRNRNLHQRKLLQFVQQNPMSTLNPKKTVFSTISLPLKIHKIVAKDKITERVKELLSYVGLESEFMYRYPPFRIRTWIQIWIQDPDLDPDPWGPG